MKILYTTDYGIKPDQDITVELFKLIEAAGQIDGKKTIRFEKGTYFSAVKNLKSICSILPIR